MKTQALRTRQAIATMINFILLLMLETSQYCPCVSSETHPAAETLRRRELQGHVTILTGSAHRVKSFKIVTGTQFFDSA